MHHKEIPYESLEVFTIGNVKEGSKWYDRKHSFVQCFGSFSSGDELRWFWIIALDFLLFSRCINILWFPSTKICIWLINWRAWGIANSYSIGKGCYFNSYSSNCFTKFCVFLDRHLTVLMYIHVRLWAHCLALYIISCSAWLLLYFVSHLPGYALGTLLGIVF